jgi:ATP-dependent DNA helicase RecQ
MTMNPNTKHRRWHSLFRRQGGHCPDCGCKLTKQQSQMHHVVPRSLGGRDALYNLVLLCPSCHGWRHTAERNCA